MSRYDIEQLLDRYLKGETNASENDLIEKWLTENEPENTDWKRLDRKEREQWMIDLFSDIQGSINKSDNNVVEEVQISRKKTIIKLWKNVAAVAAMLTLFVTLIANWSAIQHGNDPVKLAIISVPVNQKKKITLDDGSVVWINSSTELKYPKTFSGPTREVYLSGEAYFDIHHNAAKPFIVHTGKVMTTVLGTAFNINASKNLSTVVVTVTRGKVSVADQGRVLGDITPNQQMTYNIKKKIESKITIDAKSVIGWQGDLYFDNITFEDAANLLQQRFNVKIGFTNNKVRTCRFSGTALEGNNLDQILKVVCAFNHAVYKYNMDGSITIDGNGCN
jgi:transmembrane sensor